MWVAPLFAQNNPSTKLNEQQKTNTKPNTHPSSTVPSSKKQNTNTREIPKTTPTIAQKDKTKEKATKNADSKASAKDNKSINTSPTQHTPNKQIGDKPKESKEKNRPSQSSKNKQLTSNTPATPPKPWVNIDTSLIAQRTIRGNISPKSVVHNGNGLFFAQNMMYNHTVTVYDRSFTLLKTIADRVQLANFDLNNADQYEGEYKGAPVEAAFSHNGQYAWVSNYRMYGKGFSQDFGDQCEMSQNYEHSFLYRINTQTFAIDAVVEVGSVPKYVAATPNDRYILVSNWCSGDLSIIDTRTNKKIKSIYLGPHPRGIVIDQQSEYAYVAIMGGARIAVIDLNNFSLEWIKGVGITPRHLCIDPTNKYLYATLNNEGKVAKIDIASRKIVTKVRSGRAPRSMAISNDGLFLYVVNYNDNNISKIETKTMCVVQKKKTQVHPIGITYDEQNKHIWVACYSGCIQVFEDRRLPYQGSPKMQKEKQAKTDRETDVETDVETDTETSIPTVTPPTTHITLLPPTKSVDKDTTPMPPPNTLRSFRVIVASFGTNELHKAKKAMREWKKAGFMPELINESRLGRYRISCACFSNEAEATQKLTDIQCNGTPDAWLLKE